MESLVEEQNNELHAHSKRSYPATKCSTEVRTVTPFRHSTPCNPHTGKPLSWIDPLLLSRGEDFPGYTHPNSLPNTQEDRVTRIQNSELAYRPLAFLKHSFPNKSQWDGNIATFRAYKQEMEGFYIQNLIPKLNATTSCNFMQYFLFCKSNCETNKLITSI